jgi:glycosyltransferase involved in cell wall biosynthesis
MKNERIIINTPKPLISVILPTYNRAWILEQAVDSVLDQNYANLELIVVDDGSNDDSPRLLSAYGDRVHCIRQTNRGVSAARNAGIRAAGGELIALLDSDDEWLPGKVTAQVDYFKIHPDALICQTQELWIRNGLRVNPGKRHRKEAGMIFERSLELCLVSPSAVMMRRSLLDDVGLFDETLLACEDYDLWLRIAWKHPIHLIDQPLIVKRGGHEDQLSRMPELDKFRIQAIANLLERGCLSPDQRIAAIAMLTTKCAIYAQGCRKRGRTGEATRYEQMVAKYQKESVR